jgi:predicted RNA-binding Zn ribbon-like protein
MADLIWVANTRHGPAGHWFARPKVDDGDHDHLATEAQAAKYLGDHGVSIPPQEPTQVNLDTLASVREMVRALVDPACGWTDDVRAVLRAARFELAPDGRLLPVRPGWDGFTDELMLPLLQVMAMRDRLRICGNPVCRLVFLDRSSNKGRQWCDSAGCGNRSRVRRYRSRSTPQNVAAGASAVGS